MSVPANAQTVVGSKESIQLVKNQIICSAYFKRYSDAKDDYLAEVYRWSAVRWVMKIRSVDEDSALKEVDRIRGNVQKNYAELWQSASNRDQFVVGCPKVDPREYKWANVKFAVQAEKPKGSKAKSASAIRPGFVALLSLTGETYQLPFSATDTVLDLKKQLSEQESIQVSWQTLRFKGKLLEDAKTLGSYGMKEKDAIYLIVHMP